MLRLLEQRLKPLQPQPATDEGSPPTEVAGGQPESQSSVAVSHQSAGTPASRSSNRIRARMGLTYSEVLQTGVPERRRYVLTAPRKPYTGKPRGRPRGSKNRN